MPEWNPTPEEIDREAERLWRAAAAPETYLPDWSAVHPDTQERYRNKARWTIGIGDWL